MFNFLDKIKQDPAFYKQISIGNQLVTEFNCPLESNQEGIWSEQSYFAYVIEGKKVWHVPGNKFEMTEGKCAFVKKGAHLIEQFFDTRFCVIFFFLTDQFIIETIREVMPSPKLSVKKSDSSPVLILETDETLHAFFNSVAPYFLTQNNVNRSLLELKCKELILNAVHNLSNEELRSYFCSLLTEGGAERMKKIMEENFYYNLSLDDFAKLCDRSLSSFKRDFTKIFNVSPGRWLTDRRLQHAELLLNTSSKNVSEIAFDCGFENTSHFSRAFKDKFGRTALQLRQNPS